MAKALVVVESPAKAKTINKYLGRDYKVVASMGHIRDLPKSKLGVETDNEFAADYEIIPARKKVVKELKDAAKDVADIYVATDPDREGEAIGADIADELGGGRKRRRIHRLMFNEITKPAILAAIKKPGAINGHMVEAQRARRVLDRLVGYKISPLLWDKVRRGLSAGRVQSVALKLVCDREREILAFVPEEYWHITAALAGPVPPEFEARLVRRGKDVVRIENEAQARAILAELEHAPFVVSSVTTKERKKHAAPPFITSKLQQTARFPVKKTMMIAQQLYEGIELPSPDGPVTVGLITYMRTDSTRVSDQALGEVRDHIRGAYGEEFVPEKPNFYRAKADAQDAHEAIRPTSMLYDPESIRAHLTPDQYSVYRLIWNRFVASQMPPAVFDDTTVEISAGDYLFRVKGSVPKFRGWLAAYGPAITGVGDTPADAAGAAQKEDGEDEAASGVLPPLAQGDRLDVKGFKPEQKFTQPPPRYTEATLVKELEENGIGRPSTYASIIGVLQDRDYVQKTEGKFRPTQLGMIVEEELSRNFAKSNDDVLDVQYTAHMEELLDEIEQGKTDYVATLTSFYEKFRRDLDEAQLRNFKEGEPTGEMCERCGQQMVKQVGKFGPFLACSAYPECTNTKELETADVEGEEAEPEPCENCGRPMVMKRGKWGQFLACSGYPECKTTRKVIQTKQGLKAAKPDQVIDEKCPRCGNNLVIKQGRFGEFTACTSYPECRYVKHKTTGVTCPKDPEKGGEIVERKSRRGKVFFGCSNYPDCDFVLWNRPIPEPCPECGAKFLVEKVTKKHGRQLKCETCTFVRDAELTPA
jgi:DNA topoisomerase I